ncbi:MAG: hypothetical protein JXQ73_01290 [Phycisphaerae bacterium]|nr:hypothetical protein [Phycisphaerae bacterium]
MTAMTGMRVVLLSLLMAAPAAGRPTVSLDGVWQFRFSADDSGERDGWFKPETTFDKTLKVPGCWDSQGIGEPTEKVRHNAVGVGWHRRSFAVPKEWANRRIWLRVGAAHRSAKVWIDGERIGEHWGYPVAFSFDITGAVTPGKEHALVIAVDSRRHLDRDPLTGAFDIIDYMDVDWGGIFEPVTLYATGDVWLDDAFVLPDPAAGKAGVRVTMSRVEPGTADPTAIEFRVRRWTAQGVGEAVVTSGKQEVGKQAKLSWDLALGDVPPWTPETPNLLVLDLVLKRGDQVLDERSIRFGQRRLEIRGADFYLNGERFYFRGYGDDWTFPVTLMPAPDVEAWRKYLLRRKEFGLIGVRHHSTMPPEAYLAAADEVGILVQPELPIAYAPFFNAANERGYDLYRYVWRGYIRQMRNHPSVFAWCMNNEMREGFALGPELYATAKLLDPTRPVIDADGAAGDLNRPTIDYIAFQYDVFAIPWGRHYAKFKMASPPTKPIISHETTNISVLPDPADIPKYDGIIDPFWIQQMADQVSRRGLSGYLDRMLTASRRLQASLIKLNIEACRVNPDTDGHHQWLFRDYWTQSTGIVNQFDEARALTPEMARQFFGQVVVLWEHDRVNFRCGQTIPLRLFLSDFRPKAARPRLSEMSVTLGDQSVSLQAPSSAGGRGLIGPWTGEVRAPKSAAPVALVLQARCGGVRNQWPVWVFPASSEKGDVVGTSERAPSDSVPMVTRWLTKTALERLAAGGRVWVVDEKVVLPTALGRFKPAWWKGSEKTDSGYGNMILPHPAMEGFPHDGYGDLQMAGLLDERPTVLMDALPVQIEPIIWYLDVPWQMRRKAYLFEAKVGAGRLLVSTLNVSREQRERDPAAAWLFGRLLGYVRSDAFNPQVELPMEWLRKRAVDSGRADLSSCVEGFAKVLECTEPPSTWHSYLEDSVGNHAVRQTDGKQKLRWATAIVPKDWSKDSVTFVWAGGIGWQSEPGGGHFSLAVNGSHVLDFPFAQASATWRSQDEAVCLRYWVRRTVGVDSFGLFTLTVPASMARPGSAVELTVTATKQGSKRWFAVNPYTDVTVRERRCF